MQDSAAGVGLFRQGQRRHSFLMLLVQAADLFFARPVERFFQLGPRPFQLLTGLQHTGLHLRPVQAQQQIALPHGRPVPPRCRGHPGREFGRDIYPRPVHLSLDEGVFPVDIQQAGQSHDRDPRSHQPQYCRQQETTHHLFLLQRARIPRKSIPASSRASASASRAGEIAENMG